MAISKGVFEARGVSSDQLPKAVVDLLPLDEKAEADSAVRVEQSTGPASPSLVQDTTQLTCCSATWLRPDLAPRDRSLVTIIALPARSSTSPIISTGRWIMG